MNNKRKDVLASAKDVLAIGKSAVDAYAETIRAIRQDRPYMQLNDDSAEVPSLETVWFDSLQRQGDPSHECE
jgi:hypothetical protein